MRADNWQVASASPVSDLAEPGPTQLISAGIMSSRLDSRDSSRLGQPGHQAPQQIRHSSLHLALCVSPTALFIYLIPNYTE